MGLREMSPQQRALLDLETARRIRNMHSGMSDEFSFVRKQREFADQLEKDANRKLGIKEE